MIAVINSDHVTCYSTQEKVLAVLALFMSSVVSGLGFSVGVSVLLLLLRFGNAKAAPMPQDLQDFWNESLAIQERGLVCSAKLNRSIIELIEKK